MRSVASRAAYLLTLVAALVAVFVVGSARAASSPDTTSAPRAYSYELLPHLSSATPAESSATPSHGRSSATPAATTAGPSWPRAATGFAAEDTGGALRAFRSGSGSVGQGPNLTLDEARAAAESRGVDTSCVKLCYQPRTDPSWRPNTYGFSRFTMSDAPYVDANGMWEVTLTDMGLQSEDTAAWTIAHELGHLTEVGPWDEPGAEAFAARMLGGG